MLKRGHDGMLGATEVREIPHYEGICAVCGRFARFENNRQSVRESFPCPKCKASQRYRHQAEMLLAHFARSGSASLVELALEPEFSGLRIYEPGVAGPFRRCFAGLANYVNSAYWDGVEPGEYRNGVRCENLEALTFPDESFDLMISSDIMEHVRNPDAAWREAARVLRKGGQYVFTVPFSWPISARTVARVDVSGPDDVHILEPRYHGDPLNPEGALVYNDFGLDIADRLGSAGFDVLLPRSLLYTITVVARRT